MQLSCALWPCCAKSQLYHVYPEELGLVWPYDLVDLTESTLRWTALVPWSTWCSAVRWSVLFPPERSANQKLFFEKCVIPGYRWHGPAPEPQGSILSPTQPCHELHTYLFPLHIPQIPWFLPDYMATCIVWFCCWALSHSGPASKLAAFCVIWYGVEQYSQVGNALPPKPKGAHLTLSFLLHAGWRWEVQSPLSFTLEDMSLAYPRLLVPKNFTEMSIRPLNLHSVFFRSLQCMCLIKASSTLAHCSSGPSWCSARYLGSIGLLRLGRERAGSLTALGQDGNCVLLSVPREYELWSLLLMGKEMIHTH